MALLPHLFHPEAGDLMHSFSLEDDSLWAPEAPRSLTDPRGQDYNSQNPELQGARVRRSGEVCGAKVFPGGSSVVALSTLGASVLLAQVQRQEELVLGLQHLLTS